jgi:uncharacterized protein (TIGR02118 family)
VTARAARLADAAGCRHCLGEGQRDREAAMIRVSVFYPQSPGSPFDMVYYLGKHIPMVRERLGAACKAVTVEQGLSGGAPGAPPTYLAIVHLTFDSVEAFQAAFAPHVDAIMADIPNYTSIQPVIQVSDVKM